MIFFRWRHHLPKINNFKEEEEEKNAFHQLVHLVIEHILLYVNKSHTDKIFNEFGDFLFFLVFERDREGCVNNG